MCIPRHPRGIGLISAVFGLALSGLTIASAITWLDDRHRARVAQEAVRQTSHVASAARTLVTSNFVDYLATIGGAGQHSITVQDLVDGGTLPASFPRRSSLGRPWRIQMLPDGTTAITLLVTEEVAAADTVWPSTAAHGTDEPVGVVQADPVGCTGVCLAGPRTLANVEAFQTAFAPHPRPRALAVIARVDRDSVCGDYLYRVDVSARCGPEANRMQTALDMGGNNILQAGGISATSIEVASDFLVRGTLTANGGLTVDQRLDVTRGQVEIYGGLTAETITSTGPLVTPAITVNGPLETGTMTVTGDLTADSMTVTGELDASDIIATRSITTNRLEAPIVTAADEATVGFANVTGELTANSLVISGTLHYDGPLDANLNVRTLDVSGPATFTGRIAVGGEGCFGC